MTFDAPMIGSEKHEGCSSGDFPKPEGGFASDVRKGGCPRQNGRPTHRANGEGRSATDRTAKSRSKTSQMNEARSTSGSERSIRGLGIPDE